MWHDHALAWIDRHEAHLQSFTRDDSDNSIVKAHGNPRIVHHRKGSVDGSRAPENREFFWRVPEALAGAHQMLIVGPAQAKHEFVKYLENHQPQLAKKIVAVETVDHLTDCQLLVHARRFFESADRMLAQPGTRHI